MQLSYRADIDGLRAIAVLSVLFFHADVPGFAGGFVGVDVFFVISGFLIGGILLREIEEDRFTFTGFYQRRIRRILPALLVVLFTTSIIAWLLFLPSDLVRYAKWVGTAIFMVPNIASWHVINDYFAPAANFQPLLHLWSLGIEEQFYLLFPVILVFVLRWKSTRLHIILLGVAILLSFFGAGWGALNWPSASFYLLPTRAWELLIGLAAVCYSRCTVSRNVAFCRLSPLFLEVFAALGTLLIILAIISPWKNIGLKSALIYQAMACAGVVILIVIGCKYQTVINQLLALPLFVGIGLISYSLYLWHWPLLSFLNYQAAWTEEVSWQSISVVIIVSFVLAFVTWTYIEQPFREGQRFSFRVVLSGVVVAQIVLLVFSGVVLSLQGWTGHFSIQQLHYSDGLRDMNPLRKDCHYGHNTLNPQLDLDNCLLGEKNKTAPQFLVWGDSHADSIVPAFEVLGRQYGVLGVQMSYSGGGTLLKVKRNRWTDEQNKKFVTFMNRALATIKNNDSLTNIFLMNRSLSYSYDLSPYEARSGGGVNPKPLSYTGEDALNSVTAFRLGLENVVSELLSAGKRVWLILPIPEADRHPPQWLAKNITHSGKVWVKGYPERRQLLLPMFYELRAKYGERVRLLDPMSYLCKDDSSECLIAANGRSLYRDDDHLSAHGARFIADMLIPAFELMSNEEGKGFKTEPAQK